MGELSARELARELSDEWHELEDVGGVSLHGYMRLTEHEYALWATVQELPRDFEKRHQ